MLQFQPKVGKTRLVNGRWMPFKTSVKLQLNLNYLFVVGVQKPFELRGRLFTIVIASSQFVTTIRCLSLQNRASLWVSSMAEKNATRCKRG